ncbi:MAG: GTP 3',8-cyclase MoaA [Sulfurimicrobium sp.]|nr:GTP 3',8-cyclase MoaA [Sulfurimicrobium sp.]
MTTHTKLLDGCGRAIEYLRLSVTDRCDLRCTYCIPPGFRDFVTPSHWLTFDEIEQVVGLLARAGLKKVRLTGGEPLTRPGLGDLARRLRQIPGIADLSLSTNGTRLAELAGTLRQAGIARINVSLDTLDAGRFMKITGRDALANVLNGLETARDTGFSLVKINMVVMGGVNDDEVDAMVEYCAERGFILRLIETMPLGVAGSSVQHVNLQPVKQRLQSRYGLIDGAVPGGGPAKYLVSPDGHLNVGFITPLSQHFCASCNRIRLSADGKLYTCLDGLASMDVGALIRSGASEMELMSALTDALLSKPVRHDFGMSHSRENRVMAAIGG